jgi:C4-dicarboxylate transporter/malic acid transport protein
MFTALRLARTKVSPIWFTSVMGTGILAVTIAGSPVALPAGALLASTLWLLASILLAALVALVIASLADDSSRLFGTYSDPSAMQAWGALPMACFTVAVGALTIGRRLIVPATAVHLAQDLFIVGVIGAVLLAFLIPFLMFTRHELASDVTSATWLLPIVPLIVASVPSALLIPTWPAALRSSMLAFGYAMWGCGIMLAMIVIVLHYARLVQFRVPDGALVTSVWLVVGPLGQSIAGFNALDAAASTLWPAPAPILQGTGLTYGIAVWGFAAYWLVMAIALTLRTARTKLPFALGWWAFTFPVGVLTAGTYSLATLTASPFFRAAGLVLLTLLAFMWVLVAVATTRHALAELAQIAEGDPLVTPETLPMHHGTAN